MTKRVKFEPTDCLEHTLAPNDYLPAHRPEPPRTDEGPPEFRATHAGGRQFVAVVQDQATSTLCGGNAKMMEAVFHCWLQKQQGERENE